MSGLMNNDEPLAASPYTKGEATARELTMRVAHTLREVVGVEQDPLGGLLYEVPASYAEGGDGLLCLSQLAERIVARLARRCAMPALEVVSGVEAAALPEDSIVVESDRDGTPLQETERMPARTIGYLSREQHEEVVSWEYARVLHRGAPPTPPLAVGDVVETAEQLDDLAVGAIVEDRCRNVASRLDPDIIDLGDACWGITGLDGPAHGSELYFPATVRYLPTGTGGG